MPESSFDLVILGGGPGGYVAGIRAGQLGIRTAVVEREHLGGICLNWGCIPTKALLRAAELRRNIAAAESFGFAVGPVEIRWPKVIERSRQVARQLSGGVRHLLKKHHVTVIDGHGRLKGAGRIDVTTQSAEQHLTAGHVIIATGARARVLPGLEPDGQLVWSYKEAMVPAAMPRRLLVVGSGAIGIEFASFYRDLGAEVTVVELVDRILPAEDAEISAAARKQFEKQGIRILTDAKVTAVKKHADHLKVSVQAGGRKEDITVDRLISAVGITANIEDCGLDTIKLKIERGHIVTDAAMATAAEGVSAIGDVAGAPWLAHKAMHEGVIAVERLAGRPVHPIDRTRIPGCTYSHPQIASVGLTEEAARAAGHKLRIGRFPLIGNGKALALGETEGLVKTLFDERTGELLGAHMIGPEVTELIQGYGIARTLEATEAELIATIFPHPTLSESMHEAVLAAHEGALHY